MGSDSGGGAEREPESGYHRAAKTSKEDFLGLVTALEVFLAEGQKDETHGHRLGLPIVKGGAC